jgi:alkanesulfonate monooxygenase SsuD/methylene tetrahydromethanopterin reductase-like flavin-dependent oxidoreductase (luciferase family)
MGTPDDVRKQIKRFNDIGIELILMKLLPNVENIQRLGAEVIQPLRR